MSAADRSAITMQQLIGERDFTGAGRTATVSLFRILLR